MPLPPPKALPIRSVRAAAGRAGRASVSTPMLAVETKSNGICSPRQSCGWTCRPFPGVVQSMDDDTSELIAQLCTRIGMIMEDASVVALTVGGLTVKERDDAIAALEAAAERISALVAAAKALTPYRPLCWTPRN